jgi:NADH dehydrogenase
MATIGRNAAVAELPSGRRLKGFIGWLAWLFVHILNLIGFRNRVSVMLSWMYNYFTYDRSARLILDVVPEVPSYSPEVDFVKQEEGLAERESVRRS